jgi:hypothetical protein
LFVVGMMFVLIGARGAGRHDPQQGALLLGLLAAVPLWMPLPIGFRLPRPQLAALRLLPLTPLRLASALLVVPILAPFVLQVVGMLLLLVTGRTTAASVPAVLAGYLALSTTLLAVEGMFVLRRPHPNSVNILSAFAQILTQLVVLLPGVLALLVVQHVTGGLTWGLLGAVALQTPINAGLLTSLGRQVQSRELEGATP